MAVAAISENRKSPYLGQSLTITPFKVIQGQRFCTNRKLICDFLLVINTVTSYLAPLPRYGLRQEVSKY